MFLAHIRYGKGATRCIALQLQRATTDLILVFSKAAKKKKSKRFWGYFKSYIKFSLLNVGVSPDDEARYIIFSRTKV